MFAAAWEGYLNARREVYGDVMRLTRVRRTLMDIATVGAKTPQEARAPDPTWIFQRRSTPARFMWTCMPMSDAAADGGTEDWLLMFKNETHNHPTEIEPYGGAATCIGGAIRDPLSGQGLCLSGHAPHRRGRSPGPHRRHTPGQAAAAEADGDSRPGVLLLRKPDRARHRARA